ncbi:caspase family protein [Umezawaea tangerina]|uniref:Putative caspase-like protein n=1 Tax=Umezawaea tangerina TaxID=84725 RepID=A0A2T0SGQ6_9PSEU|nr:caspase family protein [Umezawaea tangerina]PRY32585.1 putative caspase-like protein [Umezawaea tangerina]
MSKSYVLSVGIDKYQSIAIPNLSWAANDARVFYDELTQGRASTSVESLLLIDDQATTSTIRDAMGDWLKTANEEDNIVAFFAGHGARELPVGADIRNGTEAYLLPSDADMDHLYATSISLSNELPIILKRISAGNVTFIFDCCLAGSSRTFDSKFRSRGMDGPNFTKIQAISDVWLNAAVTADNGSLHDVGEGVSVLMACGPNQVALEDSALKHGVFTYHLLEVLAEYRKSGSISVSLGNVYAEVVKLVLDHTQATQVPVLEGRLADQQLYVGR